MTPANMIGLAGYVGFAIFLGIWIYKMIRQRQKKKEAAVEHQKNRERKLRRRKK